MKNCLKIKTFSMSLMIITFFILSTSIATAQSVRVLNSNPDDGGGWITCTRGDLLNISLYVELYNVDYFQITNIDIAGLSGQYTHMSISTLKDNSNNTKGDNKPSYRTVEATELYRIDLTLINHFGHYGQPGDFIDFDVTISYGVSVGHSSSPPVTEFFTVQHCIASEYLSSREAQISTPPVRVENISPNPTKNVFTVDLAISEATELSINLMDRLGRTVKQITLKETVDVGNYVKEVDISDLPQGVYFLTIPLKDKVITEKIMKL